MKISNWIVITFVVLAAIGFADAAFLTAQHVSGALPPCSVDSGCNVVLTSVYSEVFGIPIAAFGTLYYAAMLVLMVAYLDTWNRRILHWASWATTAGLLMSVCLVVVQAFVLHSFCPYCLVSAGTSTGLFVLGVVIMRQD